MKIQGLCLSAAAAVSLAAVLAGCGTTSYYAGRTLPPSGIANRVLIAVQNPSASTKGALTFVDAYYDTRYKYNSSSTTYSISGYSGSEPTTIQNMPNEQYGAVYGSGDGSFELIDYAKEKLGSTISGLSGLSPSIFITSDLKYVFAANQGSRVFTVIDSGTAIHLSLPGVYRTSVNVGGSAALAFVQNSDNAYYPIKLTSAEQAAFTGGDANWPKAAVDCEPQIEPTWCLMQAQSPDYSDARGSLWGSYGAALAFDRPVKAIFSGDGATAYILNCGPECGGSQASISILPVAPMIFTPGLRSGKLPTQAELDDSTDASRRKIPIQSSDGSVLGGASNALLSGSTIYVVGQMCTGTASECTSSASYWAGKLTVLNTAKFFSTNSPLIAGPTSISDGTPGGASRMILSDDDTLWIGMTGCTNGYRAANNMSTGCLTMFNTSSNSVTLIEGTSGDATGIASVDGLHKIYAAVGGQVHIYNTADGTERDNEYVTVTGTAYDVAYMDAYTDSNNTVY